VWAAILIFPGSDWAAPENTLSGRVLDASGAPIANAEVRIQASLTEWTTTDAQGRFELRTARPVGESVDVAAGSLDAAGEHPAFYNSRLAVLVGDTGLELRLDATPMGDDPSYTFTNPQDCRLCHGALYDYWQDSPHRNAAKNTWVRDVYDGQGTPGTGANGFVYKEAHPGFKGDCAECHAPMDSAKNPGDNTDFGVLSAAAREYGVSCDVCHKTYDVGELGLPGVQKMVMARASRETIFGPLPDAAPNFPGVMRASYSRIHENGKLCASCHQANNDHDFDLDYLDPGSVPDENTWTEWLASPYAQPGAGMRTCMDCHMPPKGDLAMCEQYGPVTRDPSQVYSHDFEGTTDEYVQNAGTLRLVASRVGTELRVTAAVTNDRTGHDLPGGQNIRHAILLVTATDGDGTPLEVVAGRTSVVPEYGGVGDPGAGYWAGLPGKGFAKIFGNDEATNVFFTEATRIDADTRIPAGATDWSDYVFFVGDHLGETVNVEARLVYRRAFRALADEKGWVLTGHGRPNPDLIGPEYGVRLAPAAIAVPVPGPAIDATNVMGAKALKFRLVAGASPPFEVGATVEVTDPTGAWVAFSTPSRVKGGGTKLTQKGRLDGLTLGQFWENGAERFVRVTNPDGGATVLRLRRDGARFTPV
jgi:hypothetical protein